MADPRMHAKAYKDRVTSTLKNFGAPALIAGSAAGSAGLVDAAINDEVERAASKLDGIQNFLDESNGVEGSWNFVFGGEARPPIEKQSMARVLQGIDDTADVAILESTGVLPRIDRVLTERPDLAPILGKNIQAEVDVNVSEIEHGISQQEIANSDGVNTLGPLAASVIAGGGMAAAMRRR